MHGSLACPCRLATSPLTITDEEIGQVAEFVRSEWVRLGIVGSAESRPTFGDEVRREADRLKRSISQNALKIPLGGRLGKKRITMRIPPKCPE